MPSRAQLARMRALFSRRSHRSIEQISLHTNLYHIRPYCSQSTLTLINQMCLRRLLKSNYDCSFNKSDRISQLKSFPNKSTFILGHYLFTVQSNQLRLYAIDNHRLHLLGEDLCTIKLVYIAVCAYGDMNMEYSKRVLPPRDGFILMTSDQRLLLYDLQLRRRMSSFDIRFQCEISVKFVEKSFDYHEQNYMISFHARYKRRSHLFVLLRMWPRWVSYVFLVEPDIFGLDLTQAAITHELLIVQKQNNRCELFSIHTILDQYTVVSHPLSNQPLPHNVIFTSRPPCLFTFAGDRPSFDYAFCSTEHFLTRLGGDYFILNINHQQSLVSNGQLRRLWTDNLLPTNQVYLVDTNTNNDDIIDIRESIVHVWRLDMLDDDTVNVKHLYSIDDGSGMLTSNKQTNLHVSRYGRQSIYQQLTDLSASVIITDHHFDTYNNLLTIIFEYELSDMALIRVVEHPTGVYCQDIHLKKNNKQNQLKVMLEHDKLIVQERSCHTVTLRMFTLQRPK